MGSSGKYENMNKKEVVEWYENLPDEARMKLQKDFGNDGVPDRETKFYTWLKSFVKSKKK